MLDTKIIQDSYSILQPRLGALADKFYEVLWSDFPKTQALFVTTEIDKQKAGFIEGMDFIITHLHQGPVLEKYLEDMGIRHSCYGIKAKHYEWVSACLMKSLKHCYADSWQGRVEESWKDAVGLIVQVMRAGADKVRMKSA